MFSPLNGAPLNGGPSAETVVSASSATSAEADASAEAYVVRGMQADASAEAEGQVDDGLLDIQIVMVPSTCRGRAHSWIDERHISVYEVTRHWVRGTSVGRSVSRALANTLIGTGITESQATLHDEPDGCFFYRNHAGSVVGQAEVVSDPSRIRILSGSMVARASTFLAPTIERDGGDRESYAHAKALVEASISVDYVNYTPPTPDGETITLEAEAGTEITAYRLHGYEAEGVARAELSLHADMTNVNLWAFATGQAEVEAEISVEAIQYHLFEAEADGVGEVESEAENRVTRPFGADSTAEAEVALDVTRYAWQIAADDGAATVDIEAAIYTWRQMQDSSTLAEGDSYARGLRLVFPGAEASIAESTLAPATFKINAGDPASATRTLVVAPAERMVVVPPAERELVA